jgi:hypothetical protein
LGVVVLILLPALGLIGVGLNGVQDSEMKLDAANAATAILTKRLAAPASPSASVLPQIDAADFANLPTQPPTSATKVSYIDSGGDDASSDATSAAFTLSYRVWQDNQTLAGSSVKLVRIDIVLSWPPNAPVKAHNQYELITSALVSP